MLQYVTKGISFCFLCGILFFDISVTIRPLQADENAIGHNGTRRVETEKKWTGTRVAHDGCVLRLLVPESSPITELPLNVIIENRGGRRFECGETGYFLDCIVTLTSKAGVRVPYTKKGRTVFSGQRSEGQYANVTFTAGRLRSWEFNLADAFEPLEKGKYRLTLEANVVFETPGTENEPLGSEKFKTRVQLVAKDVLFVISSATSAR